MARKFGLDAVLQVEGRVLSMGASYHENGQILLDHLLGACFQSYPDGEDQGGSDPPIIVTDECCHVERRRPYVNAWREPSKIYLC